MIDQRRLVKHSFGKGMDNISAETALPRGPQGEYLTAREIVNADVDRNGVISRRLGPNVDTFLPLLDSHSLWSDGSRLFGVAEGALLEFDPAVSPPVVKNTLAGVSPALPMSYAEAAGIVFYGNGAESGRILADGSVAPIWVPAPDYLPQAVVSSGGFLPAGYYHLAFTWVEDDTRLESGAPEPMSVYVAHSAGDVTAPASNTSLPTQAIVLTGLPQRQGCKLNIYCSVSGGDALHRQATIPYGTTSHTLTKVSLAGKKLEHLLLADEMPAGAILEAHKGRLLAAVGKAIYFSLPGSYGLTRLDENFLQFAADVNLVAATEDGFYVGADKTYWVSGLAQGTPTIETVHAAKPVPGTRCRVPAHLVGLNDAAVPKVGTVPYWFSSAGPMIGLPGGKVLPLTEDAIAHRVYGSGASGFRAINGIASVVTTVRDPGVENRMGVGDSVEVEVRRTGRPHLPGARSAAVGESLGIGDTVSVEVYTPPWWGDAEVVYLAATAESPGQALTNLGTSGATNDAVIHGTVGFNTTTGFEFRSTSATPAGYLSTGASTAVIRTLVVACKGVVSKGWVQHHGAFGDAQLRLGVITGAAGDFGAGDQGVVGVGSVAGDHVFAVSPAGAYLDGVNVWPWSAAFPLDGAELFVGAYNAGGTPYGGCNMDVAAVFMYSRTLSDQDIADLTANIISVIG